MTRKEVRKTIIDAGLFKQEDELYYYFNLIGSDEIYVYIEYYDNQIRWRNSKTHKNISFEEVLQIVPKDIAVKLCYHLDLFT